jgi:hypothetical protein
MNLINRNLKETFYVKFQVGKSFCFNLKKKGLAILQGLFMKAFKNPYDLYFYQQQISLF